MSTVGTLKETRLGRNLSPNVNVSNVERAISIIGGGTMLLVGMRHRSWGGLLLSLAGSALVHRGISGHCVAYAALQRTGASAPTEEIARDIHVEKSITINKSASELYSFWREFENLPEIMSHVESVITSEPGYSHWVVKAAGKTFEWDAEIYNEKPNELIAWRSLPGSDVVNAGSVHFESGPPGRGTRVTVVVNYNITGGRFTALFAKLFGAEPGQMIEDDLRRFKQLMEANEFATIEGQPSGRKPLEQTTSRKPSKKAVGSMESARERGQINVA